MPGRSKTAWIVAMGMVAAGMLLCRPPDSFKKKQLEFPRVREAFSQKSAGLEKVFREKGVAYPPKAIFIRVFKLERQLELWARHEAKARFVLIKTYRVCALSGMLGPKRYEGDRQIPEGFYHITTFNPFSRFHLSLEIDYPNASDRILGKRGRLGGTIFIHGSCVTIGCVPIKDDNIEEVYLLAVEARASGQAAIPVHIFPLRFTKEKMAELQRQFYWDRGTWSFWDNIATGYYAFEVTHRLPRISVAHDGRYRVTGNPE